MSLVVLLPAEAQDDVVGSPDLDAHANVEIDHKEERNEEEAKRGQLQQGRVGLKHATECRLLKNFPSSERMAKIKVKIKWTMHNALWAMTHH